MAVNAVGFQSVTVRGRLDTLAFKTGSIALNFASLVLVAVLCNDFQSALGSSKVTRSAPRQDFGRGFPP